MATINGTFSIPAGGTAKVTLEVDFWTDDSKHGAANTGKIIEAVQAAANARKPKAKR